MINARRKEVLTSRPGADALHPLQAAASRREPAARLRLSSFTDTAAWTWQRHDLDYRGLRIARCSRWDISAHVGDLTGLVVSVPADAERVAVERYSAGLPVRAETSGPGALDGLAGAISLLVPESELIRFCGQHDRRASAPEEPLDGMSQQVVAAAVRQLWEVRGRIDPIIRQHLADVVLSSLSAPMADKSAPLRGGLARWQLRRVIECMDENLAEDLALSKLASLVGLSSNHFCTAFRESTGEPPHKFLIRRRLTRAQELLADRRMSVTEIALATGFSSSAHFTTSFRKALGLTPSAYRQQMHF